MNLSRIDKTLPCLLDNLALDEALLLDAEDGQSGQVLRFWTWPMPAVVLGAGSSLKDDVYEDRCLTDNVPIVRRSSGGGTVLLNEGCLLYSLVLDTSLNPVLSDIRSSYDWILGKIANALIPDSNDSIQGTSDLSLLNCKWSGNAQQRKKKYILHHGTILYNFDNSVVKKYLKMPVRQPEYRSQRHHTDFLTNINLPIDIIIKLISDEWQAQNNVYQINAQRIEELVRSKYGTPGWLLKR